MRIRITGLAIAEGKTIIVRDSNPAALNWVARPGYEAKPMHMKGKSLKPEDLQHLSGAERAKYEGLASARGMSLAERAELSNRGYRIAGPGDMELIRGPNGQKYYSDVDLHGVYETNGSNGWNSIFEEKIKCGMLDRGVQHGPHDLWSLRNDPVKAGQNYGPQIGNGRTVTAILPDGSMVWAQTLQQMKALYKSIGVDFRSIYPNH